MGKRGPRQPVRLATTDDLAAIHPPERPPVPWNRMVLTEAQAAEFLQVKPTTFRSWAQGGKVPRYRLGGEFRYYVYDLLDLMEEGRIPDSIT